MGTGQENTGVTLARGDALALNAIYAQSDTLVRCDSLERHHFSMD